MRRTILALALIYTVFGWSLPARAYTLQFTDSSATIQIRWPTTNITVALSNSLISPPANIKAGSDVLGAARRALSRWEQVSNVRFNVTTSSATQISPNGGGGDGISLITVSSDNSAEFSGPNSVRTGRTRTFFNPATGGVTESDIALNPNISFSTDGTTGTYDIESVLTHEIGHLLGLEHSAILGATMAPFQGQNGYYGAPAVTPRSLSEDDRDGIRTIYGPAAGTSISGTVRDAANQPVFGAHVWAEDAGNGHVVGGNVTLSNGSYRIDNLPVSTYRMIVEPLDGPISAQSIPAAGGGYSGLITNPPPPFRTSEYPAQINLNSSPVVGGINFTVSGTPSLNPTWVGLNGQLSTVVAPIDAGKTYTVYVGGNGMVQGQVQASGISITSPYFTINQASLAFISFTDLSTGQLIPAASFDVTVAPNAPFGDYSIRIQNKNNSDDIAYLSGVLSVDPGATFLVNTTNTAPPYFTGNVIDDARFFVRQQYLDFLGREPDQGGWDYWTSQITQCGVDAACVSARRREVSAAYFFSDEFQKTGYFVYRLYKSALGRQPSFNEFNTDRNQVVAGGNLDAARQAFAEAFVQRAAFLAKYPATQGRDAFIDALIANVMQSSNVDLSSHRAELIATYNSGTSLTNSRALTLLKLIDYPEYSQRGFPQSEFNPAFVLMQYFGYLRRDADTGGYNFWLNVLNTKLPSDDSGFRAMVCAFISSQEYQLRFGLITTRRDTDCAAG